MAYSYDNGYSHSPTHRTLKNFPGYGRRDPREQAVKAVATVERVGLRLNDEDWIGMRGEEMQLRMRRNMLRVSVDTNRHALRDQGENALLDAVLRWAQSNATDFYYVTDDATIAFLSDSDAVAFKMQFHGEIELRIFDYY
jgi:hypothetical protein